MSISSMLILPLLSFLLFLAGDVRIGLTNLFLIGASPNNLVHFLSSPTFPVFALYLESFT